MFILVHKAFAWAYFCGVCFSQIPSINIDDLVFFARMYSQLKCRVYFYQPKKIHTHKINKNAERGLFPRIVRIQNSEIEKNVLRIFIIWFKVQCKHFRIASEFQPIPSDQTCFTSIDSMSERGIHEKKFPLRYEQNTFNKNTIYYLTSSRTTDYRVERCSVC